MKNKRIIFGVSIICIIVISITLILITNKTSSRILDSNLDNTTDNLDNKAPDMFAIMLETERGSGQYQQSTSGLWPGSGYEFNSTLSQCENGGVLTWNEENRIVNLKSNLSDRCYLYFDIVPPDVTINTNNNDNYNASTPASLSCTGATAEYNQKYQRIEISSIANKYTSCNLTYQTPSSKTYLNNYIIGLSGTTQGTGQVIDEKYIEPYNYNIVAMNYSSSYIINQNNRYTSTTTTSGTRRDVQFIVSSSGYYTFNYSIPTSSATSSSGRNYVYRWNVNTTSSGERIYSTYNNGATVTGTYDLGYLNSGDYIWVRFYYYDNNPTVWFEMTNTYNTIDTGIRYEGKDPNNYIWFNDELWRIIGVFNEESHGVSGQNLVKIIRANSIGGLVWDNDTSESNYGKNDWSTSDLKNLLNGAYLNSQNGTGGEYCYGYLTTTPSNCDYREIGINDTYRPMIENVTWYLGGHSTRDATADTFYTAERGTTVYSGRPTSWAGYIGLMYPSDYGYSVLASSCPRSTNLSSYGGNATTTCAGQSWLFVQGHEFTITPDSLLSYTVFKVINGAYIDTNGAAGGMSVRPVLYLDDSVYVIDGKGSVSDPYIIGM